MVITRGVVIPSTLSLSPSVSFDFLTRDSLRLSSRTGLGDFGPIAMELPATLHGLAEMLEGAGTGCM